MDVQLNVPVCVTYLDVSASLANRPARSPGLYGPPAGPRLRCSLQLFLVAARVCRVKNVEVHWRDECSQGTPPVFP